MKTIKWGVIGLTIITITEIIFLKTMKGSIILWMLYGFYKFFYNNDITIG